MIKGYSIDIGSISQFSSKQLGLRLDEKIKTIVRSKGESVLKIGNTYDPYDLYCENEDHYAFYDIKLSCGDTVTISENECQFALNAFDNACSYYILEFTLENSNAIFNGQINLEKIIDANQLHQSKYPAKYGSLPTFYYFRNSVFDRYDFSLQSYPDYIL